eukprot:6739984-Prymnesium_polylepis.1
MPSEPLATTPAEQPAEHPPASAAVLPMRIEEYPSALALYLRPAAALARPYQARRAEHRRAPASRSQTHRRVCSGRRVHASTAGR